MKNVWKTSVTELIEIFRGALMAIIPWLEKANIAWKDGESYDDWDNIASSLFENIVCATLTGDVVNIRMIPRYDYEYESYQARDYIVVKSKKYNDKNFAFVSLKNESYKLDKVKVAELDENLNSIRFIEIPFENVKFGFVIQGKNDSNIIYEVEIEV
ncbi:MAG: hypothetical protein ACP5E3_01025 [Bacteroidales bacterium]